MNVNFRDLRKVIDKIRPTLSKRNEVETFLSICFRDGKAMTFDGVSGTITASGLDLKCCVNGKKFVTLVAALDGEGTLTVDGNWMIARSGSHITKLPVTDHQDFPNLMPKNSEVYCQAPIQAALKACAISMEKDESKRALYGVGLRGNYAYSTDGKRITRANLLMPVEHPISISKPAVDQLIRLGDPDYLFTADNNLGALYKEDKTIFVTRTVDADFPFDVLDGVFDCSYPHRFVYDVPEAMQETVDRLASLADGEEGQLILNHEDGDLTIRTVTNETGLSSEPIPFACPKNWSVRVKADTLNRCLKRLSPKTIELSDVLNGQRRMLLFHGENYSHAMSLMA